MQLYQLSRFMLVKQKVKIRTYDKELLYEGYMVNIPNTLHNKEIILITIENKSFVIMVNN